MSKYPVASGTYELVLVLPFLMVIQLLTVLPVLMGWGGGGANPAVNTDAAR